MQQLPWLYGGEDVSFTRACKTVSNRAIAEKSSRRIRVEFASNLGISFALWRKQLLREKLGPLRKRINVRRWFHSLAWLQIFILTSRRVYCSELIDRTCFAWDRVENKERTRDRKMIGRWLWRRHWWKLRESMRFLLLQVIVTMHITDWEYVNFYSFYGITTRNIPRKCGRAFIYSVNEKISPWRIESVNEIAFTRSINVASIANCADIIKDCARNFRLCQETHRRASWASCLWMEWNRNFHASNK